MTEFLLPGAGIPAVSEASQPARSSSAKPGSTAFSGLLRRAAQSLRQSGTTDASAPSPSLFSSSLPFVTIPSAGSAGNSSVPATSIAQAESSLLANAPVRVVTDASLQAEIPTEAPAQVNSEILNPAPPDGEVVLSQMQDVLHTLAGLATTLLQQDQVQNDPAHTPVADLPVDTAVVATMEDAPGENNSNTATLVKDSIVPAGEMSKNIEPEQRGIEAEKADISTVSCDNEAVSVSETLRAEIPSLVVPSREDIVVPGKPVPNAAIPPAENKTLSGTIDEGSISTESSVDTVSADTKPRKQSAATNQENVIIPLDEKEPIETTNTFVSEENRDTLHVFVPSIGIVVIQPQPAEDGTLHLNVEIPHEIPQTPAVLHTLLRDVVGEMERLVADKKVDDSPLVSPGVLPDQVEGSPTSIQQTDEKRDNAVVATAVPAELNSTIVQVNAQDVMLNESSEIQSESTAVTSGEISEKDTIRQPKEEKNDVNPKKTAPLERFHTDAKARVTVPTEPLPFVETGSIPSSKASDSLPASVPQVSVTEVHTVDAEYAPVVRAEPVVTPDVPINSSWIISPDEKPLIPLSGENVLASVEQNPVTVPEPVSSFPEVRQSQNVAQVHREATTPSPKLPVGAIHFTFAATPKQEATVVVPAENSVSARTDKAAIPVTEIPVDTLPSVSEDGVAVEIPSKPENPDSPISTETWIRAEQNPPSEPRSVPAGKSEQAHTPEIDSAFAESVLPSHSTMAQPKELLENHTRSEKPVGPSVVQNAMPEPVVSLTGSVQPEIPSVVHTDSLEQTIPAAVQDNTGFDNIVAPSGEDGAVKVPLIAVPTHDTLRTAQADTGEEIQSFFPYIKPVEEPQQQDDIPRTERPEVPLVTDSESRQETGKMTVSDDVPTVSPSDIPAPDVSHVPSQPVVEKVVAEGPEIGTLQPREVADVDTFASIVDDNKRVPDNLVSEPVYVHPQQQNNENSIRRNNGSVENFPAVQQPDITSGRTIPESVVEPLPVQLQTTGDVVRLDALLQEVQRNDATVVKLSIAMPRQTSDMKNHSPKANSNQTENTVRDNILTESTKTPVSSPVRTVPEKVTVPVENYNVQKTARSEQPVVDVQIPEPEVDHNPKFGTSIEGLSQHRRNSDNVPVVTPLEAGSLEKQPVDLSGQQTVRETAGANSVSRVVSQPLAGSNAVGQVSVDTAQVVPDYRKRSEPGTIEPIVSKTGAYSAQQSQQEAEPVGEQSNVLRTGGTVDTEQAISSENREISVPRSLPVEGNISPTADTVSFPEQNDIARAGALYQTVVRSGVPVRTTAGRLSAARNAVESLREHPAATIPVGAGKEVGEPLVSEPLMRSNGEGQQNPQTPFKREEQNNTLLFPRNEQNVTADSGTARKATAFTDEQPVASEETHSKNSVRPESIHPGIPLPMMPKVTAPVVRAYRNVPQQEIPQIVHNAVRTFPAGTGGAIQMALAPEALGEVLVSISVRESVTEVRIDTETQESRKIVEAQLPALRDKLAQAGLQVEHIEVRTKQQDTVQSDAFRSGRQGSQTQEEQKSRQDFVRSFRHLAGDEGREQPDADTKRIHSYRIRGGNFERYA